MSSSFAAPRRRARRRRVRARRPRIRPQRIRLAVAVTLLLALVLSGGWFLLRDSPLVSVDHVTITGVDGADAAAIGTALRSAARSMTTLDVQDAQLRAAVSRFPEVTGLQVSTQLPHGIAIHVVEQRPVAEVSVGGRNVPVTGNGRLLPGRWATGSLPTIPLPEPLMGGRVTQRWVLAAVRLLEAAPYRMLAKVVDVTTVAGHGLVGQLRDGPAIYFGDATQAAAKWIAAVAVLANSGSQGASYIDVTDPEHPAAGSTAAPATGATSAGAGATAAGAGATAAGAGATAAGAGATAAAAGAGTTAATPTASTGSPSAATSSGAPSGG